VRSIASIDAAARLLLQRSPNLLVIPGTSSIDRLRENLAAAELVLPASALVRVDPAASR
jgi:pyridoxine 4-dehydrogenase